MKKSLSLLTVAVLATMAGGVNAYTLTTGTDDVEDDFSYHGTEADAFGISVTGDGTNASFTGSTIDVSPLVTRPRRGVMPLWQTVIRTITITRF